MISGGVGPVKPSPAPRSRPHRSGGRLVGHDRLGDDRADRPGRRDTPGDCRLPHGDRRAAPARGGRLVGALRGVSPRADRWRCLVLGVCMAAFQVTYFNAVPRAGIAIAALIAICGAPLLITGAGRRRARRAVDRAPRASRSPSACTGTALLIAGPRTTADLSARFVAGVAAGPRREPGLRALRGARQGHAGAHRAAAGDRRHLHGGRPGARADTGGRRCRPAAGARLALARLSRRRHHRRRLRHLFAGLRDVSASAAGVASLIEPLTATLLGVFLFGERLGAARRAGRRAPVRRARPAA